MSNEHEETRGVCPLCEGNANLSECDESDKWSVVCARCGHFEISREAKQFLPYEKDRQLLSGVARQCWERDGKPLLILGRGYEDLKKLAPDRKNVAEKARCLLLALERRTEYPGSPVNLSLETDYPLAFSQNVEEFRYYLRHLKTLGLTDLHDSVRDNWQATISPKGWAAIDSYSKPNAESDKVFVAMWFAAEMEPVYLEGMQPAIEKDCGYKSIRIDRQQFVGDVVDEILAEIRESRFVVADVTGQRAGVYYEAGFALGMELPVIWCCRKDEMDKVHFDTRQQNHIVWEAAEDLRTQLKNRIRAVIGLGPHKQQ